jgi:hypothetical protein
MLCVHYCLLLCSSEENNLVRKDLKNIFLLLWLDFRQKQQPKEKERGVCQFAKRKKAFLSSSSNIRMDYARALLYK